MASPQPLDVASATLLASVVVGLIRFRLLRLGAVYPSLVFFFACEFAIVTASDVFGVGTSAYAYSFLILVPLEWIAFGFVMRELYNAVFERYRGIQILGRWGIYAALFTGFALAIAGAVSTGHLIARLRTGVIGLEFASGCVIFGSLVLMLSILLAISYYPVELHRNIIVNCRYFALFMLVEAVEIVINKFTVRHYTLALNLAAIVISALVLLAWPMLLSRQGEEIFLKLRRGIGAVEEARLLGQLSAFNTLLLRVARK